MTGSTKDQIAFDVETGRILEILSSEIYDSPKAFLRENVQNAYDAILMRFAQQEMPIGTAEINVTVEENRLTVHDAGIGMTELVLRNNFWKAGSSGKKTELAQRAGVIGTFGIGAMANFGVCTKLLVETRHIDSDITLISTARREDLRIAQNCIELERVSDGRDPGTTIVADLDSSFRITEAEAKDYLDQYIRFLPVRVLLNGQLISQKSFEDTLAGRAAGFENIAVRNIANNGLAGRLDVSVNSQSRLLARLTNIALAGSEISGEVFLVQGGGQTHAFRNLFGLSPIPVSGYYELGGFVNLDILQPTAGREAISRNGVQRVAELVELIEAEASKDIAKTDAADNNQQFQQYILSNGLTTLAQNITISLLPAKEMLRLGQVAAYQAEKSQHFYSGKDAMVLERFASDNANLLYVSASNPRRKLQIKYLSQILRLGEVPNQVLIETISPSELEFNEAMFLVRLRGVLLDDYLMPDVDVAFAIMSHGVNFHAERRGDVLEVSIARRISSVQMVIECYTTARDVFEGFLKDFVREHLYPHIRDEVPSSTRQGRDALYQRLKRNRDLFRLQMNDYGAIESLLADYLAGRTDLSEVLRTSRSRASVQHQELTREQVGSVEDAFPDIVMAAELPDGSNELEATPPIKREDIYTEVKVLTVSDEHQKLNHFRMFLAVSDRMVKREGEFLRWPHTTKLIWGAHRIIYIFSDATGDLSLYYDIELKSPLESQLTGGSMFPTTTIVTKNRIFVPVPNQLMEAFRITEEGKEFFVRFDSIP